MPSAPHILVLGYNAWDVSLPVAELPGRDQKCEVPTIHLGGGGPGATAAFALARLGANVDFVTRFGDDLPSALQREELANAGVAMQWSSVAPGFESPKAVILVHPESGDRAILWSRGDLPPIDPASVQTEWLNGQDLFYSDGHEPVAAQIVAAAARRRGIPVVVDAGSVRNGSAELVATASDVISSEGFAPDLTGCQRPDEALLALRERGPERVAMTFGNRGVLALVGDKFCHVAAFEVPVVDTTGAGDAFHAGYAYCLAGGGDFLACLRFGSAVAALKCGDWGGRRGLPTLPEVQKLLIGGTECPVPLEFTPFLD